MRSAWPWPPEHQRGESTCGHCSHVDIDSSVAPQAFGARDGPDSAAAEGVALRRLLRDGERFAGDQVPMAVAETIDAGPLGSRHVPGWNLQLTRERPVRRRTSLRSAPRPPPV